MWNIFLYVRDGKPCHFYNAKLLAYGLSVTRYSRRWWE